MASLSAFPGTAASLSNAGTSENAEAWVTPGNIGADDGTTSSITAATYDTPDISQLLVASNFGFSIPAGSTIDGIVVEIERNNAAGAASDNRVQLAKGTTFASLVGTNKADTALDWPATLTLKSYGGTTDLWGTTWTVAEINASSFALMLSVQADAANTDIAVDYVRITVHYTPPTIDTVSQGGATAGGTGPSARTSSSTGGATAGGTAPTAITSSGFAGATAGGATAIAIARVDLAGATAGGFAPTEIIEGGGVTDTVSFGGATAGGFTATARATSSTGGASAGGTSPSVRASSSSGGATAGGPAPGSRSTAGLAGALAGGVAPRAIATSAAGGALAGGVSPSDGGPVIDTVSFGGAAGGGWAPLARVSVGTGGALAGGFASSSSSTASTGGASAGGVGPGALVRADRGGALAGGFAIVEGADVKTARFDAPRPGSRQIRSSPTSAAFDP